MLQYKMMTNKRPGTLLKNIILCADDYAQNSSISEGIIQLAKQNRINAISCMANSELWGELYPILFSVQSTTYIGLHLDFTHGNALSPTWKKYHGTQFQGLSSLLKNAWLRRLNPEAIAAEIQAQLDAFTYSLNVLPDFIDGHQHIHQFPVIRDALLAVCSERLPNSFMRKTSNGWRDMVVADGFPKRQLIALLGGVEFQYRLKQQSMPCNTSFSGIYNFKRAKNYRRYFNRFLTHSQHEGLIMCHPGKRSTDMDDPLGLYRHHEFDYFMSDEYLCDMKNHSFQLKQKVQLS